MEMLLILGLAFLIGGFHGIGVVVVALFVIGMLVALFSD
jgi:hypothetical protein